MFERFSEAARNTVVQAREEAGRLQHPYVGTEHLLLALLRDQGGAGAALRHAGLTVEATDAAIENYLGKAGPGLDAEALRSIGIDISEVKARIEEHFGPVPLESAPPVVSRGRFGLRRRRAEAPPAFRGRFSVRAKKVLELGLRESIRLKSGFIGNEHLLLGLLREGEGLAMLVLGKTAGVDVAELRRQVEAQLRPAA